ncbi:hypothetical protein [Cohnella sp. AR92]|uniref:hypothetical protein n=1 Tax=Cohnella sp. AR92 TaxID=648716 RepID=UPI000F8C4A3D|nr:hypothetical protein [Cohnella sp. AR92]RUS45553.1 hypothetical protein ELR57_19580 [Cohnella sp. AR92]
MLNSLIKIISTCSFDDIYLSGFIDPEEEDVVEFTPWSHCLFFEFAAQLIKIESVDQYSKLRITYSTNLLTDVDMDDFVPSKARISYLIFKNPLAKNKIIRMEFYELEEQIDQLICDALKIQLQNNQVLFLDPSYLAINIGGLEVEEEWLHNSKEEYQPKSTVIEV